MTWPSRNSWPGAARSSAALLRPFEQRLADPLVAVLGMDVDVDVVVADERGVGDDHVSFDDHDRVLLEVEPGHVPVGEEVVELEVGGAELVDVARDDESR